MKYALAAFALLSTQFFPLNIRYDERIVLESADKKTLLLQRKGSGAEGGMSLEFVLKQDGQAEKKYLISRTFNPGDGSKSETVREAACRAALETLRKDAPSLRIMVNPGACAADRTRVLEPLAHREAAGAEPHSCKNNEIPYFEAGCEGRGTVKCWPENIRPTPMETCLCNGTQGNAPLPGGGLRWRHTGKCK